jgi:hypothetical protein
MKTWTRVHPAAGGAESHALSCVTFRFIHLDPRERFDPPALQPPGHSLANVYLFGSYRRCPKRGLFGHGERLILVSVPGDSHLEPETTVQLQLSGHLPYRQRRREGTVCHRCARLGCGKLRIVFR